MLNSQLWIEPLGNVVVVRVRGELTESMLKEIHDRVIQLLRDTEYTRVLYDALEMESPDIDIALLQEKLNEKTKQLFADQSLRKAILVSNTRLGYLSRIAFGQFGEGDYRVFYNDLSHALQWLET